MNMLGDEIVESHCSVESCNYQIPVAVFEKTNYFNCIEGKQCAGKVEWHVADHERRKYVPVSWNRGLKRTVPSVLSFIRAVHTMTPSLSRLLSASGQRDTPAQSETRLVLFLGESKAPFFQRIKTPV